MHSIPVPTPSATNIRNAWSKVKQDGDCWIWTGSRRNGYAELGIEGTAYRAHRLFFSWFKCDIAEELVIDHLCGNRLCVNPDHLESVTQMTNIRRAKGKYCKRGHALVDPNLYYYHRKSDGRRMRRCQPCMVIKAEAARAARRARGLKKPGRKAAV